VKVTPSADVAKRVASFPPWKYRNRESSAVFQIASGLET